MKNCTLVFLAASLVGVGTSNVWVLAHRNETNQQFLNGVMARAENTGRRPAEPPGSEDLPRMLAALSTPDTALEETYLWLCSALPEAISQWLPEVYPSAMIRLNAAAAVGRWGPSARPFVAALVRLLNDDLADGNAALSLGLIGSGAREASPALLAAAREQRPNAAAALRKLGCSVRTARPAPTATSE